MATNDVAVRAPIPAVETGGVDQVPAGWWEATVAPWADQQTAEDIQDAARRLDAIDAAARKMGMQVLELTKARRYLEVRMGELLLDGVIGTVAPHLNTPYKRLASYKSVVVSLIRDAEDADELTRAALLRAIDEVDPAIQKQRKKERKQRNARTTKQKKRQQEAERALANQQAAKAAKRRGDHHAKAWSHLQHLMQELDAAIDEELTKLEPGPRDGWMAQNQRLDLLHDARGHFQAGWDDLGKALRL